MTVRATVTSVDRASGRVRLDCLCHNQGGTSVIEGEALVLAPREKVSRPVPTLPDVRLHHPGARLALLVQRARALPPLPTAVVHPFDTASLTGALQAAEAGLIKPLPVGPRAKILAVADATGLVVDESRIIDDPHSHASAELAVAAVRAGRDGALMKGKLHTDELLAAVLSRSAGLRTERRLSDIFTLYVPDHPRLLHITDAAINIARDLPALAEIVRNALELVRAEGVDCPRAALLSAVETVSDRLPSTLLAAAICKMHDHGQITGGLVDGPLAFDNAISAAAARNKGITSPVAGLADILVAPNLESGNMIANQLIHLAGAEAAGIALGAQVPIMLPCRAETAAARVASAALARLAAAYPV